MWTWQSRCFRWPSWTLPGGFDSAESIQAALRKGSAYDADQLSRGLIAYGAIIALQSPEFVAGVRQFAVDPVQRQQVVAQIVADPAYAAMLRELDDLGCEFAWREQDGQSVFAASCGKEVVGESAEQPAQAAIYAVLDQAAEKLDVLA